MRFNVGGYDMTFGTPDFTLGRVVGTIGVASDMLVFDTFVPDDPITWWGSLQPTFQQYANLYPVMALFLDLSDDSGRENRELLLAFGLDVRDPNLNAGDPSASARARPRSPTARSAGRALRLHRPRDRVRRRRCAPAAARPDKRVLCNRQRGAPRQRLLQLRVHEPAEDPARDVQRTAEAVDGDRGADGVLQAAGRGHRDAWPSATRVRRSELPVIGQPIRGGRLPDVQRFRAAP
jgi:hypothetical protein